MDATLLSIRRFYNFLLIDAIDRSKISSDQTRLFFAVSLYPFHFSRTLPWTTKSSTNYCLKYKYFLFLHFLTFPKYESEKVIKILKHTFISFLIFKCKHFYLFLFIFEHVMYVSMLKKKNVALAKKKKFSLCHPQAIHERTQKVSAHSVQPFGRLIVNIYTNVLLYYIDLNYCCGHCIFVFVFLKIDMRARIFQIVIYQGRINNNIKREYVVCSWQIINF